MRYQFRFNSFIKKMYYNNVFRKLKSKYGNTCAQLYMNDDDFWYVVVISPKEEAGNYLSFYFQAIGVNINIHNYQASYKKCVRWN